MPQLSLISVRPASHFTSIVPWSSCHQLLSLIFRHPVMLLPSYPSQTSNPCIATRSPFPTTRQAESPLRLSTLSAAPLSASLPSGPSSFHGCRTPNSGGWTNPFALRSRASAVLDTYHLRTFPPYRSSYKPKQKSCMLSFRRSVHKVSRAQFVEVSEPRQFSRLSKEPDRLNRRYLFLCYRHDPGKIVPLAPALETTHPHG